VLSEKRANILLVEDDPSIASLLMDRLESRRYRVSCAADAEQAQQLLAQSRPDLVILDLMLPDGNGLLLCADLKAELQVPIILCSATRRREDCLLGFKLGADDFVAKPFSVDELEARIAVALRRTTAAPPPRSLGELVVDEATCEARLDGEVLPLTRTEFRLLGTLVSQSGQVVSHQTLTEAVWGYHDPAVTRTLEVHLRRLRAKLNAAGPAAPRLVTQRGFGYRIVADLAAAQDEVPDACRPTPAAD
jgi:DNA-binding response OmpR family regulator